MNIWQKFLHFGSDKSPLFARIVRYLFASDPQWARRELEDNFLGHYIRSFYDSASLKEKRFYNIGAGNQRSRYSFWSYVDLAYSKYDKSNIDVFYDLESLEPLPLPSNESELVFNSFVMEHISRQATENLCREAYRTLKPGGVFHCKVHSYEYSYQLLRKGVICPKIPFECRESRELLDALLLRTKGQVNAYFNEQKHYVVASKSDPSDSVYFSPESSFAYYNAVAAIPNLNEQGMEATIQKLLAEHANMPSFYRALKNKYVDPALKEPHQHNADFLAQEELFTYIKDLGFSEVYFTQPYQSVSPALWEEVLNPIHRGYLYSIEAVK